MISWVNGRECNSLSVADRGLAYGDGLFETLKVRDGKPLRLELHLQRLQKGCQRLGLELDMQLLQAEILVFCASAGSSLCKLIVTRGDGPRGYAVPKQAQIRRILQAGALPDWPESFAREGVRLYACHTRLAIQPLLAGLKHLNRLEQVLARAEWQDPAYAEGLMLDTSGRITDCVFSNVFFVRKGQLLTPCLKDCGVEGVMRAAIMQKARQLGLGCEIVQMLPEELAGMDEVFVCNSLYGIWPVAGYQNHHWQPGPVTRTLQQAMAD